MKTWENAIIVLTGVASRRRERPCPGSVKGDDR